MDPRSDAELARALRDGDVSAFEAFYARYHEWVATLALRYSGHREDALDVLQETFAYLFRRRHDFELRSQMKTFLYPVVKHLALARRQAARRQAPLPKADPAAPPAPADETAALLTGLSEAQQEVVLMRFVDGLDLQAIADALDVPLGTVKSRLHSALELLRGKTPPNR
ncbi:MAG TPA: RNA polymerase sigma factor [Planctomycetota bacterium]|nr:RNA polymerase sigma factor [Planctomycetota bacterium]